MTLVSFGATLVQVRGQNVACGPRAQFWRKLGSKWGSWAILGAKKNQEGGKAPLGRGGAKMYHAPVARFCQKFSIFTSVLGSHFGTFFELFFGLFFETLLGRLRGRSGAYFGCQKRAKRSPKRSPKSSQDECAAENATKAKTCVSPRRELTFWVSEWPKTRLS